MEQLLAKPRGRAATAPVKETVSGYSPIHIAGGMEKVLTGLRIWWHICVLASRCYGSLPAAAGAIKKLWQRTKIMYGGHPGVKLVRIAGRYYYNLYTPGYPSVAYDNFMKHLLNRVMPYRAEPHRLSFIIFAITRKCPLHCEHCYEADNLNEKEVFTLSELKEVVARFQQEDLSQFFLSGGEPLVRMHDLEELVATADKKSEFWVFTSGFNLTQQNAGRLKAAGATGVVVSLDHYDREKHNAFRGFSTAYDWVVDGVRNARDNGLVTALSLCVTKSFLSWENLQRYMDLARSLGVHFVQLLEPKAAGAYKSKDVMLQPGQFKLLEAFYKTMNFDPAYKDYPVVVYHGYHQRRLGCRSGGNSNLYIDSVGSVNACPFCSTKTANIKDMLAGKVPFEIKKGGCPVMGANVKM